MATPRLTPTTMLSARPPSARYSDTNRWCSSVPDRRRSAAAAQTTEKGGRIWVPMIPLRVTSSQRAKTIRIGATRDTAAPARDRDRISIAAGREAIVTSSPDVSATAAPGRFVVLEHLFPHVQPHPVAQPRELRRRRSRLPSRGAVPLYVGGAFEAAGRGGHHDRSLGEVDGFLHRVGDEQHRLLLLPPHGQEVVLLELPGLGVEGPEGLVHEQ